MADINLTGLVTSNLAFDLLKKEVKSRTDEIKFDPTLDPILDKLGFTVDKVDDPKGTVDILAGILDLEKIGELDDIPLIEDEIVGELGYNTQRYGGKKGISRRTHKWLTNATEGDKQLPDFVKRDIKSLTMSAERLVKRAEKTKNFEITRVLTEGLTSEVSAFGAGAVLMDGEKLFSENHSVSLTDASLGVQPNKLDKALSTAALDEAFEMLRKMKDQNGTTMGVPIGGTLVIPSGLYKKAREILSGGLSFDGSEASNTNVDRVYDWEGYKLRLVVLNTLNQPSVEHGIIGDDKQWFLLDEERSRELGMLQFKYLYDNISDVEMDNASKVTFIDIDLEFTAQAYNYLGIIGSTGQV